MSRLDDLKKQNPELDISLLDLIASADPTNTNKYTSFLLNILKKNGKQTLTADQIKDQILRVIYGDKLIMLTRFEDHCSLNRIKNSDISKYKSLDDLEHEVLLADEIVRVKNLEKQVIKLYEDSEFLVLIPLSYQASKSYGAKTKWCITNEESWNEYFGRYRIIYIMDRVNKTKYAISIDFNDPADIDGFDAEDEEFNPLYFPLSGPVFEVIRKEVTKKRYQTELENLGTDVILTPEEGIVEISKATYYQIDEFLETFNTGEDSALTKEFINRLEEKKGLFEEGMGDAESEESGMIKSDDLNKFLADLEDTHTYPRYEEMIKNPSGFFSWMFTSRKF